MEKLPHIKYFKDNLPEMFGRISGSKFWLTIKKALYGSYFEPHGIWKTRDNLSKITENSAQNAYALSNLTDVKTPQKKLFWWSVVAQGCRKTFRQTLKDHDTGTTLINRRKFTENWWKTLIT